jgi:hypothetical protein
MKRIAEHERNYEPVEEMDIPWIRLVNVGEKIQINVSASSPTLIINTVTMASFRKFKAIYNPELSSS